ncbi:MAG: tryptophan--tRNA ligase [Candidatus Pelagibacterales bacterium]|jgi:tryptophanyl-tRNA synthetase|tara:strand:+ start:3989 stop:5008 length:1020 start_codon:yes stop_codon:yes gene_type:complete
MKNINKIVLSGVQPTGGLHIGNYLGAIKNFVSMQTEYDCFFCVVDLHAITVKQDPKLLKNNTYEVVATYLASGIDPVKSVIFNQSNVSSHSELAWIFNCITRMGWLNRMTQFKDKAGKDKENASSGLFIYPNLMAADILLYKATHVPVGDDQKQHLELTRDIAQKFNRDYECDGFFPIPEPIIDKNISRIMSLKNGEQKMSKSDPSDYSRISLTDSADQIEKKIKKAKTADTPMPDNNEDVSKLLEVNNLLNIFSGFSEIDKSELIEKYKGQNFSNFKNNLAEVIIEHIKPISKEIDKLMSDKAYLNQIISSGAEKASEKANVTIKEVYDIVGFVRNET